MKRLSQLLDYIPVSALSKVAFVLMILLVIFPALMWLFGLGWLPIDNQVRIAQQTMLYNVWSTLLLQIGYLGCIFALILTGKSLMQAKREKTPVWTYINAHGLTIALALMLLWSTISTFLSNDLTTSLIGHAYRREGLLTYFSYAGILTCGMLIKDFKRIRQLLAVMVLSSLVTSIPYILNWIPGVTWSTPLHDPSVFHQFNHHGYYLVIVCMASLVLFVIEKGKPAWRWLWAISYGISVSALVLNTALGSYLAMVGGFVLCAAFEAMRDWKGLRWRLAVSAALLIGLSVVLNLAIGQLGQDLAELGQDAVKIATGASNVGSAGTGDRKSVV